MAASVWIRRPRASRHSRRRLVVGIIPSMRQPKTKCVKCGAEILAATAERTGGLCTPCKERRPRTVTLTPQEAEAELDLAATALEIRVKQLRVETKRVSLDEWQTLPAHLQASVPDWYRSLLSRHSVYGVTLEYRDKPDLFVCCFSFNGPEDFKAMMSPSSAYSPFPANGFLPIGSDASGSGNLWVMESAASAASAVYQFVLSDWGGGKPAKRNGLRFAASRLGLLLSSMAISEVSYYNSPAGVRSLIWYKDRETPPDE